MHDPPGTFTFTDRGWPTFTVGLGKRYGMATTDTIAYDRLRSSLATEIRRRRPECIPGETARVLLSYDGPTNALVGLTADGERVVFHDRSSDRAIACRYDSDGLIRGSGVRIAACGGRRAFDRWIGKMGQAYWGWLHPRYREASSHP